jgi:hypothetical protein
MSRGSPDSRAIVGGLDLDADIGSMSRLFVAGLSFAARCPLHRSARPSPVDAPAPICRDSPTSARNCLVCCRVRPNEGRATAGRSCDRDRRHDDIANPRVLRSDRGALLGRCPDLRFIHVAPSGVLAPILIATTAPRPIRQIRTSQMMLLMMLRPRRLWLLFMEWKVIEYKSI